MTAHNNCSAATEDELCVVRADRSMLGQAIVKACDLLAERIYGNPARSPGHNARIVLERALAATMPGADRSITDDAQPVAWQWFWKSRSKWVMLKLEGDPTEDELKEFRDDGLEVRPLYAAQPPAAPVDCPVCFGDGYFPKEDLSGDTRCEPCEGTGLSRSSIGHVELSDAQIKYANQLAGERRQAWSMTPDERLAMEAATRELDAEAKSILHERCSAESWLADWSSLPRDLYVTSVKSDGVVFNVTCCSVPMAIGPEVRYVLNEPQEVSMATPADVAEVLGHLATRKAADEIRKIINSAMAWQPSENGPSYDQRSRELFTKMNAALALSRIRDALR